LALSSSFASTTSGGASPRCHTPGKCSFRVGNGVHYPATYTKLQNTLQTADMGMESLADVV
jgi:hypothetical protein